MFSEIVKGLQAAVLPDMQALRQRFDLALVKKSGILRQPYHFWSQDLKINPSSKHLIWAAILLEDPEAFATAEAFATHEWLESQSVKGSPGADPALRPYPLLQRTLEELLHLSSDPSFVALLQAKVSRLLPI